MVVKVYKPTTPGRRNMSSDDFADITKKSPEKSLTSVLKKKSGRNVHGRITVRHQGGGAKRKYRKVELGNGIVGKAKVIAIEYDPARSARLALLENKEGKKFYVIAPQKIKVGKTIDFGEGAEITAGSRMLIAKIPTGTLIYNVELKPEGGAKIARSAGTAAQLLAKEGRHAHVKLPSSEVRLIEVICSASIGVVSNPEHNNIKVGKAGRKRHMGIRPSVRGKAMNPVDHPMGGGEGARSVGHKHSKTPWGAPALGFKTRNRKKKSGDLIIRGRKRKNK